MYAPLCYLSIAQENALLLFLLKLNYISIVLFIGIGIYFDAFYRASLGWFAYEPEWYDINCVNFAQSEAQSLSLFLHYLLNERADAFQHDAKGRGHENGSALVDVVRCL